MTKIYAEIIGTMILVFLGNGVVANVILSKTKGHSKSGEWLIITIGWALAVFMGITVSAPYSGAHLNPCVTISFAIIGKFNWGMVPFYILSQFIGAMLGSFFVWLLYKDHFFETQGKEEKLSVFVTVPSTKNLFSNFRSEVFTTFIFILISLYLSTEGTLFFKEEKYPIGLGSLGALPSSLVVFGIVLSLGGVTGAALNPARDLGPRIIYSIIPIPGKGKSNWDYALIPVLGPIVGCVMAATLYLFLSS
ncbi:putative glycerol uptake facilitator protein [Blattabacterium sp. (Nauphoeta cinerea)]|uniref:MIP/aquaporin family protein n=1 Tax=Blattabacterium sp. (Nauphoeta cinerea) TaxID=1316444 RepID=UPI0003B0CF99|nr:MIP/aquaporin family protein [Blattabacterium sp. (Nauphoeta cinerea)]AGW86211.1 putative glycerol uptake facilitator protein [Blattabacterium sp. (Nauphoeta cinerea)]